MQNIRSAYMIKKQSIVRGCRRTIGLLFLLLFGVLPGFSQTIPEPTPRAVCPVCGMFVAHYPNWVATVLYQDGESHHFDGPKDLFTYLLDMKKWAQGRDAKTIQSITVKEYYGLNRINAHAAFYVAGSDILGPMGHELIPFVTLEDAETFMRDHRGKKIYHFSDIDKNILSTLKNGMFE